MRSLITLLAVGVTMAGWTGSLGVAGDKDKDDVISVVALTKDYAETPADFDKKYKGKSVTVEGTVSLTGARVGKMTFLMMNGYTKPGQSYPHSVRCEESGPDFE